MTELQGRAFENATEDELREALEKAFDYRGDVTVITRDEARVEGYVFDRQSGPSLQTSFVRLFAKASGEKLTLPYSDIRGLVFSGRDTAAGKSWEAWVKRYWERKQAGETAIANEPEMLDDLPDQPHSAAPDNSAERAGSES